GRARGCVEAGGGESARQGGGDRPAKPQAEEMTGSPVGRNAVQAEIVLRPLRDRVVARLQSGKHARNAPAKQQLERGPDRRIESEVAAFADVETPGPGFILASVVDEAGEILRILACDPVLLDRSRVLPTRGDIKKSGTVGAEQPFIGSDGDKIGIDTLDVEGQGSKRLASIDAEGGADAAARGADGLD